MPKRDNTESRWRKKVEKQNRIQREREDSFAKEMREMENYSNRPDLLIFLTKENHLVEAIHKDEPETGWGEDVMNLGDPEDDLDGCIENLLEFVIKESPDEMRGE